MEEGDDGDDYVSCLSADKRYIWSCGLLEFGLFNMGCDPFAVPSAYSKAQTQDREGEEIANDRRVFGDYFDKLRRKWSKPILNVLVCLSCKCMSAMTFRGLIALAESYKYPTVHQYLKQVSWFVGDPYSSALLATCGTLVSLGNPIICVHSRCSLAYQFAHDQPLDSTFVRFMLDPQGEMLRIDKEACKRIDESIEALRKYRSDLSDVILMYQQFESTLANHSDPGVKSTIAGWQTSLRRAKKQSIFLELLRSHPSLIRPKAFSYKEHKRSYLSFLIYSSVSCGGMLVAILILQIAFNYFTWIVRCEERWISEIEHLTNEHTKDFSICPVIEVFSWPELLTIVDMMIIPNVDLTFTYIFLFVVHMFQVSHQLYLTSNISSGLDRLLLDLRSFDVRPGDPLDDEQVEQLSRIDCLLYTSIISLSIHERESRRNAKMLSKIPLSAAISNFIYTVICFGVHTGTENEPIRSETARKSDSMFILIDSIGNYKLNGDSNIAVIIWFYIWIAVNMISLPCASNSSHVLSMKRTILFIMAEICRLQSTMRPNKLSLTFRRLNEPLRDFQGSPGDLSASDPLASLWRKFVLSEEFDTDHYSAKLLDTEISYKNIIELNMLVCTLISLLPSRVADRSHVSGDGSSLL